MARKKVTHEEINLAFEAASEHLPEGSNVMPMADSRSILVCHGVAQDYSNTALKGHLEFLKLINTTVEDIEHSEV